ncbi:MAG: alpha/beta hydrolase [Chloroflexi bacterium]|nr:alpha/beta hydrolase [Chloroflexota bacterium]MCC6897275.1 alpha/beta hydrolase [Anaerolineae bacterium]
MKKVFILFMILVLGTGIIAAQETEITLEPLNDTHFGLTTVVPSGWTSLGNGLLQRGATPEDVTLLGIQSAPFKIDALMDAVLPQLGLSEVPESVGTLETETLTWTLYKVDVSAGAQTVMVDLAVTEADNKSYLVLLQTSPEDYDALHEAVFLPVVEALEIVKPNVADLPYVVEELTFTNEDVTLAGTLTLPEGKGPFPAVVLVSGSGPQDRDETIGAMKPLGLVADELTRAGMAVLRYDDRGVGGSGGDIFATIEETTADAAAALDFLSKRPEINADELGILGHSEGGIVAAGLGATDPNIDFIIVMAGPGVTGKEVLQEQGRQILKAEGGSDEMIEAQTSAQPAIWEAIENDDREKFIELATQATLEVAQLLPEADRESLGDLETYAKTSAEQQAAGYFNPWFRSFLATDPAADWAQTTVPVLAVFGGKDVQVPAEQNAPAIEAALAEAGNEDVTIVTLPDANHLFQQAEIGSLSEYAQLDPVFTEDFVPTLVEWLQAHVTLPE